MIRTVVGDISSEKIMNTLSHEHITFGKPGYIGDDDNCYKRETAYKNALRYIDMIKRYDVDLVVDATTAERGRDPLLLKKISLDTGVFIVCSTGFFKDEDDMLAILKAMSYSVDLEKELTDLFVKEISEGIGDTGIRAGVIKTASSYGRIRPLEQTIMKAAARAAIICDVPILTHCDRGTMARSQVELMLDMKMPPEKVIIGHMTSCRDLDEIRFVMDMGLTVAFDQFGILSIPGIPNDEEKAANLLSLLREGYGEKIVLSHDTMFDRMGHSSDSRPRYPDMIYKTILPYLRENGVSEDTIRKITRDNLLRILERG